MKIMVLTGAGISAESGISTFRDSNDGLWEKHNVDDIATFEGFVREPAIVRQFYKDRLDVSNKAEPNLAHLALSQAEKHCDEVIIVTQNVDNLHERAGSSNVIHLHGQLDEQKCLTCANVQKIDDGIGCFKCGGQAFRPNVVWFGEQPYGFDKIRERLPEMDMFIAIGTSGSVYPAADIAYYATTNGIRTVELNLAEADNKNDFKENYYGKATEVVPEFLENLFKSKT